jgi:hypothetical protein
LVIRIIRVGSPYVVKRHTIGIAASAGVVFFTMASSEQRINNTDEDDGFVRFQ